MTAHSFIAERLNHQVRWIVVGADLLRLHSAISDFGLHPKILNLDMPCLAKALPVNDADCC